MDFGLNVGFYSKFKLRAQQWNGNFICSILTEHLQNQRKNSVKTTISFTTTTQSDGISFELTYPNDSEIIGSCYGNRKEGLFLDANTSLSSTWSCGPDVKYKK
jgi:hypothetical protein